MISSRLFRALQIIVSGALATLGYQAQASAQMVDVRERVSIDVPSRLFGSSPSPELRAEARMQAVDRAWRRYMAQNFSGARAQQARDSEAQLRELADRFCNFSFVDERFDRESSKFSLEVRGSCDQRAIDTEFNRLFRSVTQQPGATGRARGPMVSFVFLARRAAGAEKLDKDVATSVSTFGAGGASEQVSAGRGGSKSTESEDITVTQRQRTVSRTRDTVYSYEVEPTDDAMTAVANVLTTNGFRVARYPELVTTCTGPGMGELSRRYAEMTVNTAWNPKDTKGMFDAVRQCKVPYFAFGLMEVLQSRQVGMASYEVVVALNVKVNDLTEMLPSECASMSKQFAGRGADRLEAARAALKVAGEEGGRELIDIIRQNCL